MKQWIEKHAKTDSNGGKYIGWSFDEIKNSKFFQKFVEKCVKTDENGNKHIGWTF